MSTKTTYIFRTQSAARKWIFALLLMLLFMASCRKEPTYRIGVSQCSEDDWRISMNEEIEREIMFHPDATVEIRSAGDDSDRQIEDIRYFADNGFDIIIVAPNEADALTPVISEVYESGTPVLVFDRSVNGNQFTAFQGADNAGIGREAALYAYSHLLPDGGKAIELWGLPSSTPAEERSRGFRQVTDSLGSIAIVAEAAADWNYDDAVRVADSLLSIYPDVDLIYAHNDRMAIGAADVAARKGLHPFIIGIDAAPEIGMKAVKDGKIDATFLYPTQGDQLVKTALSILKGRDYPSKRLIPASPAVDRSNVDLLLRQNEVITNETRQLKQLKGEMDSYWNRHNSQTAFLYASVAALLLLCIVLFLVLRTFWQSRRHHDELKEKNRQLEEQRDTEKDLNRQLEAATHSKLMFFTNVSHDLRTPLTLIAEPVEQLAKAPNLTDQQRILMSIAVKNVKILYRLINQILDFRKFENDRLDLHLEEVNPGLFGKEWAEAFKVLAARMHISFQVDIRLPENFSMAMDVEKMERVAFNLLANAFKFTPVKGSVTFLMQLEGDSMQMVVSDTGKGISGEHLKSIFDRFYQVDKVRPQGSGIGLSLAKAFVELHDGSITVESKENEGTVFTVSLPVKHVDNVATPDALIQAGEAARATVRLLEDAQPQLPEVMEENDDKPLLLVIDDNEDVRLLVRELLKDEYRIIAASDGKEGVRLAARYVPDAVICDVMMPGMDGMQTCAEIKNEISTSHIPVLMLTACSMDEQRVEGYKSGADGYMAKPFNSEVLRARIASLLANRRRIKGAAALMPQVATPSEEGKKKEVPTRDVENEFYNRFLGIVNEEMGNMELSVDTLAEKMGMGRSQFYRKIKALTGLSPVELLRELRLKRARDLLLTTDKSVSEIAYEVGFSTPAYFTKCYREVYSETPTALRERIRSS